MSPAGDTTAKNGFRIENNVLIGEDAPILRECIGIGEMIFRALEESPDFVGQVDVTTDRQYTFAEMKERSVKCAVWLKSQGVKPGDIIGICANNQADAYVPILATLFIGGVINPWDHHLTVTTARHFVRLTRPKIVFVNADSTQALIQAAREEGVDVKVVTFDESPGFVSLDEISGDQDLFVVEKFRCAKVSDPGDTAAIMYSSGTTGFPKGAEISHFSFENYFSLVDIKNLSGHVSTWTPTTRWHYGLTLTLRAILTKSRRIVITDFSDLEVICQYIDKYQISFFGTDACLPIRLYKYGLLKKYKLPSLKIFFLGGIHFWKEMQEVISEAMPHTCFIQSYGMTDTGGICTYQRRNESKPSSSGYVCKSVQMKIEDLKNGEALGPNEIGEVVLKTPYVMKNYYKNLGGTKISIDSDGWVHSGDLGYYDDDGELFIVDRIAEFINYKAMNVSPAVVEAVLQSHPSVLESAVVAVPHYMDGEHPMAFVLKIPGKKVTEEELINLVSTELPDYCKLRAGIMFMDPLPRTATGKIAKKQLRDIAKGFSISS